MKTKDSMKKKWKCDAIRMSLMRVTDNSFHLFFVLFTFSSSSHMFRCKRKVQFLYFSYFSFFNGFLFCLTWGHFIYYVQNTDIVGSLVDTNIYSYFIWRESLWILMFTLLSNSKK